MILPPPVTSDCTLDHIEAYLDAVNAAKKPPQKSGTDAHDEGEQIVDRVQRPGLAQEHEVRPGQ